MHTTPRLWGLIFLMSIIFLSGCGQSPNYLAPESVGRWDSQNRDWRGNVVRNDNATSFAATAAPASDELPDADANAGHLAAPEPDASAALTRQVIYTGALTVLSPDPEAAIDAVRRLAEEAGGYAGSVRGQSVRIRVPAQQFDATMQAIAELGLVTHRQMDAADVTDQMFDLEIRLDNLEALRQRMKNLLEKAEKVEDMLNIEKELGRLTGEIEQLKGKLRLMKDRVALSTITVNFNTPAGTASGLAGRVQPFPWVNAVGSEAFGASRLPTAQPKLGKAPKLTLPDGFVRFYQHEHRVFAIDRGQVVIKVTRQLNYDQAKAGFWVDQVRDRLTKELGVPVNEPRKITIRDDETGYTMTGNRPSSGTTGNQPLGYFVGLAASDDHVFVIEAWGPAEQLDTQRDALVTSLKTLRVNKGWW